MDTLEGRSKVPNVESRCDQLRPGHPRREGISEGYFLLRRLISKLQPKLERNHPGCTVAAQADAEQPRRGRRAVSKGTESGLGGRSTGNSGKHHTRQAEIRVIKDIEELCVEPKFHPLGQEEPSR